MPSILNLGYTASNNQNRVTINASSVWLNLAKSWGLPSQDPTLVSSDGYFINTPASSVTAGMPIPSYYFGQYVWKFNGVAAMQFSPPIIIYSGAQFVANSSNSGGLGFTGSNSTITSALALSGGGSPRVVLKFGFLISSVSGGNGSSVVITSPYSVSNLGTSTVSFNQGVSSNLVNGPNSDGSWNFTVTSGTQITLTNSSGVVSPTVTGTGGVGVQSEAIIGNFSTNPTLVSGGTAWSGFSGLVFCRASDETAIAAGQIVDTTYINQLLQLYNHAGSNNTTRGWLRFMDLTSVQSSFECDFSQRMPSTYINYGVHNYRSGYWSSSGITNGGSDNYTCPDPSISTLSGGNYIDNAIVQGVVSATNSGNSPTLAVGSGPAKPIVNWTASSPIVYKCTSPPTSPGTDVLVFTFSASWLNSGVPYVFSYNTVGGDTTTSAVNANITTKIKADAVLSAALVFAGNSGTPFINPRTAQAGRLSFSYTSGSASFQVGSIYSSTISASTSTFIYNYLLDAWIYMSGGMICSAPFEAIVQMCNQAGAHCWFNAGTTKGAWITAVTQFFGDSVTGLNNGLRFGIEVYNEVWNSSANPYAFLNTLGNSLLWSQTSNVSVFSYTSLKTIQYGALAKTAWTGKGRSSSDYYNLQMTQGSNVNVNGIFDNSSLKGNSLNASTNTTYATYGGLNGGTSVSYNTAPNRPVDITNAIGFAPYWNSQWLGNGSFTSSSNFKGTVAQNTDILQAALNFANGSVSSAFTSLVNEFNGTTTKSGGLTNGLDLSSTGWPGLFTQMETLCANYDGAGRVTAGLPALAVMHYEGGPSFGVGADGNNGVNSASFNTVLAADISALATQMSGTLGWTNAQLIPYTVSGTGDFTEMSTMLLQMLQAWKFDVDNNGNPFNSGSYKGLIKTNYYQTLINTSGSNRETKPGQYGYSASNWCLFPISIYGINYKNFDAIKEWNAGG